MLEFNIFDMKICKNFDHIFKPLKSPLGVLILTKILKMEDFKNFRQNYGVILVRMFQIINIHIAQQWEIFALLTSQHPPNTLPPSQKIKIMTWSQVAVCLFILLKKQLS
jgi:hypothetical protein